MTMGVSGKRFDCGTFRRLAGMCCVYILIYLLTSSAVGGTSARGLAGTERHERAAGSIDLKEARVNREGKGFDSLLLLPSSRINDEITSAASADAGAAATVTATGHAAATAADAAEAVSLPSSTSSSSASSSSASAAGFDSFFSANKRGLPFNGTKWALLIAGSNGYWNYRHQADICHAYQLLRRNGLKDENIVVFMYDDIADNEANPLPGRIINQPNGPDVYHGVPKDYTGDAVTVPNFLAALLGVSSAVKGGSGKVVASGPNDHVFVYFSDHGGPGILGMPNLPFLFADDLVNALKAKKAIGGFAELVFYLEACESGSIFEGLLPAGINVFATTAANAEESSWGTYCPGMEPAAPEEFDTCLGDLYSVAWMEDSDVHNLEKETLDDQYKIVKLRTSNNYSFEFGSHVMKYGDRSADDDEVAQYLGTDPANEDAPPAMVPREASSFAEAAAEGPGDAGSSSRWGMLSVGQKMFLEGRSARGVKQYDADLLHFTVKAQKSPSGSPRRFEAEKQLQAVVARRQHVDDSMARIAESLVASHRWLFPTAEEAGSPFVLFSRTRPHGAALVDDWQCLRKMVRAYEQHCGYLTQYGMQYMRMFANMCNMGFTPEAVSMVARDSCALGQNGGTMKESYMVLDGKFSA